MEGARAICGLIGGMSVDGLLIGGISVDRVRPWQFKSDPCQRHSQGKKILDDKAHGLIPKGEGERVGGRMGDYPANGSDASAAFFFCLLFTSHHTSCSVLTFPLLSSRLLSSHHVSSHHTQPHNLAQVQGAHILLDRYHLDHYE